MLASLKGVGKDAEKITSVSKALKANGLDWEVEVRPTFFHKTDGSLGSMGTSFATVRTDTEAYLGRVGGDYKPMSNTEALKHVDALLIAEAGTLDSVFELKGGRQVGASVRLNETVSIGGEDPIEMFVVVTTSHDGTRADRTMITPIRMWCLNQLALISNSARQSWSVRHLSTMSDNLTLVGEELKTVANYTKWLQETGDRLIAESLREVELSKLALKAMDFMKNDAQKEKINKEIRDIFKHSELIGDDYRGTAWGGLNAVTEYFDHHKKYRSPAARYNSITSGVGARVRNNMTELLLAR